MYPIKVCRANLRRAHWLEMPFMLNRPRAKRSRLPLQQPGETAMTHPTDARMSRYGLALIIGAGIALVVYLGVM
jgi:hypothetical protein